MEPQNPEPPIACTLGPDDAQAQLQEWASLRGMFRTAEPTAHGVRRWFDPAAEAALRAVAAKEAACCAFLQFEIANDLETIRLEVTSGQSAAGPVIALLTALVSCQDSAAELSCSLMPQPQPAPPTQQPRPIVSRVGHAPLDG